MKEKRKHKRANLIYYLKICDIDTNQCVGHLVDISLGGLQMLSETELPVNEERSFSIYLPENLSQESIPVKAKTLWSRPDVNPDYYASGVRFSELSQEQAELIKTLIRSYQLGNGSSGKSY